MREKPKKSEDTALASGGRKTWFRGILLSLCLLLANMVVFQSLVQKPAVALDTHYQAANVFSFRPAELKVSLSLKDLEEFKKREHIRNLVFQSFKGISFKEKAGLFEVIYNQSLEMEIDPYLTLSIIATESSFRRRAISWAGAYGLMQIKPIAAEEVSADHGIPWQGEETLFDPVLNITLGLRYLAKLKRRFGNMGDALTAYNYGPDYVVSCLRNDKRLPDKYVKKIEGHLRRYGLNASNFLAKQNSA